MDTTSYSTNLFEGKKGEFRVYCDMDTDPEYIETVIHHDSENRKYVNGYPNPGDYVHYVSYHGLNVNQLKALKVSIVLGNKTSCNMSVKV